MAERYQYHRCDRIIAEINNGGDLVEATLRTLGDEMNSFRGIHASRGKMIRAEPVAALYEQGKVHHVGTFAKLEDQLCLVAGTLILTARGQVPIEDVTTADLVATRAGWRAVIRSGQTGVKPTMAIVASNGATIRGTADHPVWADGSGFVPLDEISLESKLPGMPYVRNPFVEFKGRRYFRQKRNGYWRSSRKDGKPEMLHVAVWTDAHGKPPRGWHVHQQ